MSRKGRKEFLCLDCDVDTGQINEYYMLADEVWYQVHTAERGMLCIGCLEARLGRMLRKKDFNGSYLNWGHFPKSDRLRDRMARI